MDRLKDGTKIGSFQRANRATKQMLEALRGKGEPVVELYLDPKNECWFEFPFPEYDSLNAGDITHQVEFFFTVPGFSKSKTHYGLSFSKHFKGVGIIENISECPMVKRDNVILKIQGQALRKDGSLVLAASCACCSACYTLSKEEAVQACEIIKTKEPADYNEEIAKRIMQTYEY